MAARNWTAKSANRRSSTPRRVTGVDCSNPGKRPSSADAYRTIRVSAGPWTGTMTGIGVHHRLLAPEGHGVPGQAPRSEETTSWVMSLPPPRFVTTEPIV
jgi:hypothetical protein